MEIFVYIFKGIFQILLMFWWILVPVLALAAWQNFRKADWAEKQNHVLLAIKVPKINDKGPVAAEMMFAALHGILKPKTNRIKEGSMQEHLSFEMIAKTDSISFFVGVPVYLKDFVESQVYAQYPQAEITETKDYTKDTDIDHDGIEDAYSCAELRLKRTDLVPIKTFKNFQVDPLAGITSALAKLDNNKEQVWIQMLVRPISDEWRLRGASYIKSKKSGKISFTGKGAFGSFFGLLGTFFSELIQSVSGTESTVQPPKLSSHEESELSAIEEKSQKLGFQVKFRILSLALDKQVADQRLLAAIGAFKQFNTINLNSIVSKKITNKKAFLSDFRTRSFYDSGFILNIEELASLYHLPHDSVETPNINWTSSRTGEPPIDLPTISNTSEEDITFFAETNFRHHKVKFGLKTDDRRRHAYIIGKSGMGKSKLLEQMIGEDIRKGNGLAVIDPNGDLIIDTLKKIPSNRVNDVILIDPADFNHPIGFNPLEVNDESLKHFVAQGFVGILAKLFGHSWGPRLEYILNYTILALLDYPDSTVLGIVRMLTDKAFRKRVVAEIKDPVVKKFWTTEFASYNEKFATEAVAPILNKVGQFTASAMIRNIIGQPKSSFDIREAMDSKKIILINLSTGRVGEVNSALLGGMIITKIQLAAMSRASVPMGKRVDFVLYVDEFQHFATDSFKTILSEARKYKLSLIIANQYIAQMDENVRDAVFGNVGTMITFRVGAQDAAVLEKELNPPFCVNDIINLDRQQVYLKMTVDGKTGNPFSAKTVSIPDIDLGNTEKIIQLSRERYSSPREEVEEKIVRWSNIDMEARPEVVSQKEETFKNEPQFKPPIVGERKFPNYKTPIVGEKNETTHLKTPLVEGKNPPLETKVHQTEAHHNHNTNTIKPKTEHKPEIKEEKKPAEKSLEENKEILKKIVSKAMEKSTITPKPFVPSKEIITRTGGLREHKKIDFNKIKEALKNATEIKKEEKPEEKKIEIKVAPKVGDEPKKEAIQLHEETLIGRPKEAIKINLKEINRKVEPEEPLINILNDNKEDNSHHKIEKNEKIITPANFKNITEIHPHEKVVIKKDEIKQEIKKDEKVIFENEQGSSPLSPN